MERTKPLVCVQPKVYNECNVIDLRSPRDVWYPRDLEECLKTIATSICQSVAEARLRLNMGRVILLDAKDGTVYKYCSYLNEILESVGVQHHIMPMIRVKLEPTPISRQPSLQDDLARVKRAVYLYPCAESKSDYEYLSAIPDSLHFFFHEDGGHICGLDVKYIPPKVNKNRLKRLRKKGR